MVGLILTGSLIFLRHFPHEVANYDRVTNLFLAKTPRGLQFSPGLIFGSEKYRAIFFSHTANFGAGRLGRGV